MPKVTVGTAVTTITRVMMMRTTKITIVIMFITAIK